MRNFEENDGCPGSLGQIGMLDDWFIVVESADYYACGFTSGAFPTDGVAATGDAYAGFASYGDFNGSAEAIGQQLPAPLPMIWPCKARGPNAMSKRNALTIRRAFMFFVFRSLKVRARSYFSCSGRVTFRTIIME